MRLRVMLWTLAVVASVAGCTNSEAGTPRATQPTAGASPTTSAKVSLPPRPRSLSLGGVDPCTVITEQQRAAFAIDRPPRGDPQSGGPLNGAPTCNYRSSTEDYGFLITTSTALGLGEYLNLLADNPTRRIITVGGFPALQDELRSNIGPGNDACFVDVDVADDHMLAMQFGQVASRKPLPMETLCAKAVEAAEAALTTLQGQR